MRDKVGEDPFFPSGDCGQSNDAWHRACFLERGKIGLYTNWIEFVAHTGYDERGHVRRLPGEKVVFMNPATTRADIDLFIENSCRRT